MRALFNGGCWLKTSTKHRNIPWGDADFITQIPWRHMTLACKMYTSQLGGGEGRGTGVMCYLGELPLNLLCIYKREDAAATPDSFLAVSSRRIHFFPAQTKPSKYCFHVTHTLFFSVSTHPSVTSTYICFTFSYALDFLKFF